MKSVVMNIVRNVVVAIGYRGIGIVLTMAGAVILQACVSLSEAPLTADLVVNNGKIYTLNNQEPWAEAAAVRNGKFIFVGTNKKVMAYIGSDTHVENLLGGMLMPGLIDAHLHPTTGAVKELFECNFPFSSGPNEISLAIESCVEKNPTAEWVRGGQWSSNFFVDHPMDSPRAFLDKAAGATAVVLVDDAYHNAWLNTRALEKLGLFNTSSSINGAEIVKDKVSGLPSGLIIEAFGFLKENLHWTSEQYLQAASHSIKTANQYGITGMKGTAMSAPEVQGYQDYAEQNSPSIHMTAALMTPYGHREGTLDLEALKIIRQRYEGTYVDANFVKIFMDGVPTVARTAAMLAPYTSENPEGDSNEPENYGALHVDPEILKQDIISLDRAGFTVKIHTAGDRSVRVALNAIEAARIANGPSGLRHELAHAGFIDSKDMNRFEALNVVADLSPYIWSPSPIIDSVITAVGKERGEEYWPIKTVLASGAAVLSGSDWPAAVATMNPWPGIESMVTRQDPSAQYPGKLWPEQAISIDQALRIFTRGNALALKKGNLTGAIEVGKSADMIVLNQNLFEVPAKDISETRVLKTWFSGRVVYSAH